MQQLILMAFLPTLAVWGFDLLGLCMDVTCQDGYYTEVVLQQIDKCPTNMTEIKKMQKKSEAVYEFDEELEKYVVKRYAKKKQAKEICKDIDEIGKVLKKGLILDSKIVELNEQKAAKEQALAKKFTICSYCKSESGSLHSAHSEPHYFTCNQRKLQCNTI